MEIPPHLKAWIVEQKPERYTAIDHAVWRYILRVSGAFFAKTAHAAYRDGLEATGIGSERIPLIHEMDERMRQIGWRAVAVSGFIPPQAFMEFQALGILPVACDMRQLEHVLYTPAPDVVHEAAGHAPIIADPDYGAYLRAFGAASRQAIYSGQDMALYRAIRRLSVAKEDPEAPPVEVEAAQADFAAATAALTWVSEAAELSRLYWWTVEYGLVGALEDPRIYGAGLLSSAGESWRCLGPEVRKLPLSLDCVRHAFDITRPQPQLFVTPDFVRLRELLEEYAAGMAWRTGGLPALEKALKAQAPTTTTLDSGLQVSGVLHELLKDDAGRPAYLRWGGSVLLADGDQPLRGHGRENHAHGFGMPLGELAEGGRGAAGLGSEDLYRLGFSGGQRGHLVFASGVVLEGRLADVREGGAGNQLLRLEDCRVTWGDDLLFDPAWGHYDLACGLEAVSVRGGWVDRSYEPEDLPAGAAEMKCNLHEGNRELDRLYQDVRLVRESGERGPLAERRLAEVAERLEREHPRDWLLRLELLELEERLPAGLGTELRARLAQLAALGPEQKELVERGMALCP